MPNEGRSPVVASRSTRALRSVLASILLEGPARGVTVERALTALSQRFASDCDERGRLSQLVGELRKVVEPLGLGGRTDRRRPGRHARQGATGSERDGR